jgi:hypothetical protein
MLVGGPRSGSAGVVVIGGGVTWSRWWKDSRGGGGIGGGIGFPSHWLVLLRVRFA